MPACFLLCCVPLKSGSWLSLSNFSRTRDSTAPGTTNPPFSSSRQTPLSCSRSRLSCCPAKKSRSEKQSVSKASTVILPLRPLLGTVSDDSQNSKAESPRRRRTSCALTALASTVRSRSFPFLPTADSHQRASGGAQSRSLGAAAPRCAAGCRAPASRRMQRAREDRRSATGSVLSPHFSVRWWWVWVPSSLGAAALWCFAPDHVRDRVSMGYVRHVLVDDRAWEGAKETDRRVEGGGGSGAAHHSRSSTEGSVPAL